MIRDLTKKKKAGSREKLEKIDALRTIRGGLTPDPAEDQPSVCSGFCNNYCGKIKNDAQMYTSNKEYR